MKQQLKQQVYLEDVETRKKINKLVARNKISEFIRIQTKRGVEELKKHD